MYPFGIGLDFKSSYGLALPEGNLRLPPLPVIASRTTRRILLPRMQNLS